MSAESVKVELGLSYEDNEHLQTTLKSLNTLRKNKHFCDVVLQIGTHEIHAHRAVLACASPYLLNLFTGGEAGHESRYKLNGGFEKAAFEILVNYAYTAKLEIPHGLVKTVYLAATRLRMDRAARKCGEYLVRNLKPENSIGIRSVPGLANDADLVAVVDNYIQQEVVDVLKSKELHALQRIQVEVLRSSKEEMEVVNCHQLCTMVLDWIKFCVDEDELNPESLTEKVHMLYVNKEHALHDCTNVQPDDFHDSELVQDYKKMSRIYQAAGMKGRKKAITAPIPAKPRQLLYSRSTSDSSICSENGQEFQWKVIACKNTAEHSFMAIVVIGGCLHSLSVVQRLNKSNKIFSSEPKPVADKQNDDYLLLPPMSSPRCAVGTAERDGKLLVCGGYDRGECLKTVQEYDPRTNIWNILSSMRHSRGRFDITVVDGKAFAVGGCDGSHELSSVECFDPDTQKWKYMSPLAVARSNAGCLAEVG